MPIKIPSSHEEPLRTLAQLRDDRQALLAALRTVKGLLDRDELVKQVAAESKIDYGTVGPWVQMLTAMYLGAATATNADVFLDEVSRRARELVEKAGDKTGADWPAFRRDLAALLACHESLGISAKASDVRTEYGAVFCKARIITDIRPIFANDPSAAPPAAVIVHTLRIAYHEADSHKEFYVAMDAVDLHRLRELLERATKKEAALRVQLAKTDMRHLEVENP